MTKLQCLLWDSCFSKQTLDLQREQQQSEDYCLIYLKTLLMDNRGRITADTIRYNLTNLRQVTFEVTDDCNLKCKYCGYGEIYCGYDKRLSKYLNFKDVKPLVDYLIEIWMDSLPDSSTPITYFSFYGGEPLLNMPFIKQTIDYIEASGLNRKILYSMTTNAVLLERYMDYLVQKNFHILISIDGNEDNHSYRVDKSGNNSFYRVTIYR